MGYELYHVWGEKGSQFYAFNNNAHIKCSSVAKGLFMIPIDAIIFQKTRHHSSGFSQRKTWIMKSKVTQVLH